MHARRYHIRDSPFNLVAGSGFFSDHLAQLPDAAVSGGGLTPSEQQASGTIAKQHAQALSHLEREIAVEAKRLSGRTAAGVTDVTDGAADEGPAFPHAPLRSPFAQPFARPSRAGDGGAATRAAAEIRAVRRRAVARGHLLGAEPDLKPAISPQQAYAATQAAAADAAAFARESAELPPRALWERRRAEVAAVAAAEEASRAWSASTGSTSITRATPGSRASLEGRARRASS